MNSISQKCQSKKPISSCNSKKNDSRNSTLADIVDEYLEEYGNSYDWEDKWWGDKNLTWSEAIERAWRSRFENGKMHGHQRRVAHKLDEGLRISKRIIISLMILVTSRTFILGLSQSPSDRLFKNW